MFILILSVFYSLSISGWSPSNCAAVILRSLNDSSVVISYSGMFHGLYVSVNQQVDTEGRLTDFITVLTFPLI